MLRIWLAERGGDDAEPVFPTRRGGPLTPEAIAWLLDKRTAIAAESYPSCEPGGVTPHMLRQTNAMLLPGPHTSSYAIWSFAPATLSAHSS